MALQNEGSFEKSTPIFLHKSPSIRNYGSIIFVVVQKPFIKNTQSPCFFILELAKKQEKNGVACYMNCIIVILDLKDVVIKKGKDTGEKINIYVEMPKRVHRFPTMWPEDKQIS